MTWLLATTKKSLKKNLNESRNECVTDFNES